MQLRAFKVEMYRPILDSEWIEVDDIAVIVGKNESGKTALLKALHKFKPFKPEPYSIDREWPRGHRKECSLDAIVARTRFDFAADEAAAIAQEFPGEDKPSGVEISKTYKGEYRYTVLPHDFPSPATTDFVIAQVGERLRPDDGTSSEFSKGLAQVRDQANEIIKSAGPVALPSKITDCKRLIDTAVQAGNQQDKTDAEAKKKALDELAKLADVKTARKRIEEMIANWIPTFIYMDDHKPFKGIAYLDQLKTKKDQNQLTDEDKTFLMILEMSGLDFEQEFRRATEKDREQRMLDMNDASLTLTTRLADHWSQRRYQVRFEADGYHVIAFVSDEVQPALVPLNERSKGFQWFFSFDTTFLYETRGTFKNAIVLLDEPGLHLHAAAQRDFLKRLKEYAKENQLIYTTHMPFMIDMERLDNIRVCTESKEYGTKVSADFYAADEHARFPLQAALGLSISQSLFVGPFNLVVEGITDFWLLSTMAAILRAEDEPSLDERIVITPAGGATKAAYVGTMLQGQQLNVVVLLDSDPEGQRVAEGLIKQWIMKDRHVVLLGQMVGRSQETTLEDLFPVDFYLQYVNRGYDKELTGKPLTPDQIAVDVHPQLIHRVDAALQARGIAANSEGWAFNKGRPAKLMLSELPKLRSSDLPPNMVGQFVRLFQRINEVMPGLSQTGEGRK
jgi:energy-coupling factor transporter ATP-binding protein EcfA2